MGRRNKERIKRIEAGLETPIAQQTPDGIAREQARLLERIRKKGIWIPGKRG